MGAHKTKATMQGRQCNTALLKRSPVIRLAAGGQTLHLSILGRLNIGQFTPLLGNILTMLRVSDTDAQNQSPNSGLAQTVCNLLKMFQTPNMAAAQNLRVRLMDAHHNPLNQLNYSDPRESANLMILLNYVESTESAKSLIIPKSTDGGLRDKHENYSGSPEHQHCLGLRNGADLRHEENQRLPDLDNGKRLSLSESDNSPSLRGAVHNSQVTKRNLQNSSGVVQTLHAEINGAQKLQVTERYPQNNPGIIGEPPILKEPHSPDDIGSAQPFESVSAGFSQIERNKSCSLLPHRGMEVEQDLKIKIALTNTANAKTIFFIAYPFGSMPRDCSSFRRVRFIQVANEESPSCFATSSSWARKSSGKRIWYCGDLFSCCVDMVVTGAYYHLHGNYHCNYSCHTKQRPEVFAALTRRLTKPLNEVTVMADQQHTQTHPEFTWRFLALSAIGRNVIHITATTEREAREQSPAGCVVVFAGRLPVQEVSHAQ